MKNANATTKQMTELGISFLKTLTGIEDAPATRVQKLIESPAEVNEIVRSILAAKVEKTLGSANEQLLEWIALYKSLGIPLDSKEVKIPEPKPGFDRLIVVPKGMTAQKAFDLCLTRFNGRCWKYTDQSLDTAVPGDKKTRTAVKGAYAIWIRNREEADEELKNLSADDLTEKRITGVTLCERLLLELKCHAETGKHLDRRNWTFCSGSLDSDSCVPRVCWRGDELRVNWGIASYGDSDLRAREAVTL